MKEKQGGLKRQALSCDTVSSVPPEQGPVLEGLYQVSKAAAFPGRSVGGPCKVPEKWRPQRSSATRACILAVAAESS